MTQTLDEPPDLKEIRKLIKDLFLQAQDAKGALEIIASGRELNGEASKLSRFAGTLTTALKPQHIRNYGTVAKLAQTMVTTYTKRGIYTGVEFQDAIGKYAAELNRGSEISGPEATRLGVALDYLLK